MFLSRSTLLGFGLERPKRPKKLRAVSFRLPVRSNGYRGNCKYSNPSSMSQEDSLIDRQKQLDAITHRIIGAAMEVHRLLGPGLLESAYEECLCLELTLGELRFERQVPLPIVYKSITLLRAYKPDLLVDGAVIVELKTIEKILPVHEAQILTYLKLSGLEAGLLINFNSIPLVSGIRRLNRSKLNSIRAVSPVSPVSPARIACDETELHRPANPEE